MTTYTPPHPASSPADLRRLSYTELDQLAGEIREFIVDAVTRHSGHLGSNLGAVELTHAGGEWSSLRHASKLQDPGWRVRTLPCGHDAMVIMPDALAALLIEAAG